MNNHYPFSLPSLPYPYDSLEPFIDTKTMHLHHDKHLQTYVNNLNNLLKDYPEYHNFSLEQLITFNEQLPSAIQTPVKNNAGGVYNHIFYFEQLTDANSNDANFNPISKLAAGIQSAFASFELFQKDMTDAALTVFGSGYAWLAADMRGELKIIKTANQDNPLPQRLFPVLCIDVWEHAYYLKHYNVRADYIKDWFRVINWNTAECNYTKCIGKK